MKFPLSKRLILFFLAYSFINYYLISIMRSGAHGSEFFITLLKGFWVISAVILLFIYLPFKRQQINLVSKVFLFFCTPIPILILLFGYNELQNIKHETVYTRNGYKVKETRYPYRKETEYRSNYDSRNGEMLMDSVIGYDDEKKKYVTDYYIDSERFFNPESN